MDASGFTPQFWLQVGLTLAAVAAGFGMIKAELKNIGRSLDLERKEREKHVEADDQSFHDIRDHLSSHHGRISVLEGKNDLAERIAEAVRAR